MFTLPSTGDGICGSGGSSLLLELLDFLLQKFHDEEAFSAGLWYFIALCSMKRALNAVTETTMIATAASMTYQKRTHEVSTVPLAVRPPATLMMEMMIVKTLRQRMPPRASLRRMLMRTFQRRRTGIEMTSHSSFQAHLAHRKCQYLRKTSVKMSKHTMASSTSVWRI